MEDKKCICREREREKEKIYKLRQIAMLFVVHYILSLEVANILTSEKRGNKDME